MNTIQTILDAEKEADQMLADARQRRHEEIEQARFETQQEISTYKTKLMNDRERELDQLKKKKDEIYEATRAEQSKTRSRIEETARSNHPTAVSTLVEKITKLTV